MDSDQRTVGSYPLTPEMNNFIDAVTAGLDVKGEAFAGTGKSSTLRAVEKYHTNKHGLYICFNKTLEQDARRLFKGNHVDIATAHSFALSSYTDIERKLWSDRVNQKLSLSHIEKYGKLDKSHALFDTLNLKKRWLLITSIIDCFFSTASKEITEIHLTDQFNQHIEKLKQNKTINSSQVDDITTFILNICNNLALEMLNPKSKCPSTHDAYLKAWQLSEPVINYDYIMFDEAQDASPVLLSVILKQECQKIFVGDRFQSIYQFRGSVNAMDIIPYETFPLSQSFRYGQGVADIANQILAHYDDTVHIRGNGTDSLIFNAKDYTPTVNTPTLVLAHNNKTLLETLVQCYEANIPARFCSNKTNATESILTSLFSLHLNGKGRIPAHTSFTSLKEIIQSTRHAETKYLANLILDDEDAAITLQKALHWTKPITEADATIHLATAHGSKGLEFDTVILADDFHEAINAFGKGKPMSDNELYLLYVAVTRAKKTLVIADELFDALQNPLAFTLNKTKPAPCLLDNLIIKPPVSTEQPGHTETQNSTGTASESESNSSSLESSKTDNVKGDSNSAPVDPQKTASKPSRKTKKQESKGNAASSTKKPSDDSQSSINIHVGTDKDTGEHLYWKPTDTDHFFNPNMAIVGTMGTGKTQTAKSILLQLHRQRERNTGGEKFGVLIFDYKNDYTDDEFVNATGAKVIEASNIPINPFALFTKHKLAPVHTAKTFITTMGRTFRLGPKQNQMLKNCIDLAYEKKGIFRNRVSTFKNPAPTLKDVFAIYNSQEKVPQDTLMSALSDLYDYEVFEPNARKCKSLFDMLDDNIVVVQLSGTDENLQSLIVAVLLDIFYIQMHQAGKPKPNGSHRALKKLVLVDEADNFMSQDFPSLKKVLKEGREFGVGCILSTQGLDHFKTADNNYADYQNAFICHRLNSPKKAQVEGILATEDKDVAAAHHTHLGQLEKHHALFINGKKEVKHQESTAFWKVVQE
ncbi:helicase HerA domain-containing protein [Vibrio sp. 10N]|uniref:helicase HerA domain-containing protein n=1 Tax=Vibrio sp. 10N TaxID=3058938 RepID=UPI00281407D6|nr:hypothetical protein VB10N_47070 [Vibrio sp. 10N]